MISVQNPGWLMIIGILLSNILGIAINPIGESLSTNQYNGITEGFWTLFISGWWYIYPSEKYDFVSWNDEIPNWMEK